MSWARMDDRYDDHPKVKRAWRRHPRAVGLHSMAITFSARHETDGIVDVDWLEEKVPGAKEREAAVATLVECGLLDPVDGERFRVHDYLDYNPSREQLEAKRKRDLERKRKGGFHEDSARNPDGIQTESAGIPNGNGADSNGIPNGASHARPQATPAALPVPARTTEGQQ